MKTKTNEIDGRVEYDDSNKQIEIKQIKQKQKQNLIYILSHSQSKRWSN